MLSSGPVHRVSQEFSLGAALVLLPQTMSHVPPPIDASTFRSVPLPIDWWWLDRNVTEADRPALLGSDGQILSRVELAAAVQNCVQFLSDHGIRRGDRLALSIAPGPARAVALLAGMATATVAPITQTALREIVEADLVRLRVTRVVVDDQPAAAVVKAAEALQLPLLHMNPFTVPSRQGVLPPAPAADDVALMLQSSGTTSRPKVVPLTHANLLAGAHAVVETLALDSADRALAAMPLFHVHGVVATLLAPLLAGGSVICCRERAVEELVAHLTNLRPTWFSASPPLLLALLEEVQVASATPPPHHLRFIRSVTMPLGSIARQRLESVFQVPVVEVYGMTEASSQVCSSRLPGPGVVHHPGTVGLPAGPDVAVLTVDGEHCPPGVVGQVVIRGPSVTPGYEGEGHSGWHRDARGESWFMTGDEGQFNDHGHLTLTGRLKEMINRGGMKVVPLRVDDALNRHPAVRESVAFAIPHPTLGEDVAAAVVLHAGATAGEQDLRDHLIAALPAHEVPSRIVFVESLPRGPGGKLQRIGLASRFTDHLHPSESPPCGQMEQLVAGIFASILGLDRPGRDANFFLLGGDSLSSLGAIHRLEQSLGMELNVGLVFLNPSVRGLAHALDLLLVDAESRVPNTAPLSPDAENDLPRRIARLREGLAAPSALDIPVATALPGPRPPDCEIYPASFGQARLWFLHQLEPGLTAYHMPALWRLCGALDRSALERAVNALIDRHSTLRTSFRLHENVVQQVIHPAFTVQLASEGLEGRDATAVANEWLREEGSTPFDLESAVQLRARLLEVGPDEHLFLLNHHHIASDGWSRNVLCEDLTALYNAALSGEQPNLPDLGVRYQDYAVWQRGRLRGARTTNLVDYWMQRLDGVESLALAADANRPPDACHAGGSVSFRIERSLLAPFEELCRAEGATLHMGLLAAVAVVLHRHTQQEDFTIGIPMWGRNHTQLEHLMGFFVNTLPIRVRFEGRQSFRQLLAQVRATSIEAYANQELPFEQIVASQKIARDPARNPLVQVMLQVASMPLPSLHGMLGLSVERLPVPPGRARFDLEFFIRQDEGRGMHGELTYDADRFAGDGIERLVGHLLTLLTSLLRDPDAPTSGLTLLPAPERQRIAAWQCGATRDGPHDVVHRLFERQAARTPDAVALICDDRSLTYADLDARANRLAHHLVAQGAGSDTLVAVCLDRSIELMVSVLAILKSGAAYLPLDRAWPALRRQRVLEASGAALLLTDEDPAAFGGATHTKTIDPTRLDLRSHSDAPPAPQRASPESLAYVLYTSGSTGRPKGVAMPHRPLVNLLAWQATCMPEAARTLQFASLGFDVSFQEIFSTWQSGGALVLVADRVRIDPSALLAMIEQRGIERLFLPVVMLGHLADAAEVSGRVPGGLRQVIVAGEQLRISPSIRRFFARLPACRLWNHYGPTETHVVTSSLLPPDPTAWPELPPIGLPIDNTQVYVLDRHMQPMPQGVAGDLWIGGAAVARGYWLQPELTADRFIPDPFLNSPHALLYRTGDRVRWRGDGQLEFLGRIDDQVKIRGQRVELGEVEAVLVTHPGVRSAAVAVCGDADTHRTLVAFVTCLPGDAPRPAHLRTWLRSLLPDAMVPTDVVVLSDLPLNANGKIDRRALADLAARRPRIMEPIGVAGMPPDSTEPDDLQDATRLPTLLEAEITRIWQRLFECDAIDHTADFFQLGGDSLMAVQMAVELERLLGHRIPIATLFEAPTIQSLARTLADESWMPGWKSLVALHPDGSRPPLFVVHGMGGDVFYASRLARLLGPDQPVYGIRAEETEGGELPTGAIEALASRYAREIRGLQPEGPYHLAGYSAGGWFAYAVATHLQCQGHAVTILIFDTNPHCVLPWPAKAWQILYFALHSITGLSYHTQKMSGMRASAWPGYIVSRAQHVLRRNRNELFDTDSSDRFTRGLARFTARVIDARVEFFQARVAWLPGLQAIPQANVWRSLVRGPVNVHPLRCRHSEIFSQAHLPTTAALVRRVLGGA